MSELFDLFIEEFFEFIVDLEKHLIRLQKKVDDKDAQKNCVRIYHTLKGNSGIIGAPNLENYFKLFEFSLKNNSDIRLELVNFLTENLENFKTILDLMKNEGKKDIEMQELANIKKKFEKFI